MATLLKDLTNETQKQIRKAKKEMKDNLSQMGISPVTTKVSAVGDVSIRIQMLKFDLEKAMSFFEKKDVKLHKKLVEGIEEFDEWAKKWSDKKVTHFLYLDYEGSDVTLNNNMSLLPQAYWRKESQDEQIAEIERKIKEEMIEEQLCEYELKQLFVGNGDDKKKLVNKKLKQINSEKQEVLVRLTKALKSELMEIVAEYCKQIEAIDFQTE